MVQQLAQRDIGGDIGRAFSQSLSEQLPKHLERQALSQGLKNLQGKEFKDPLEMASSLLGIQGMTPEVFNYVAPILRQQLAVKARQEREALEAAGGGQDQGNVSEIGLPQVEEGKRKLVTPESIAEARKTFKPMSPQEIKKEADRLFLSRPAEYPTWEDARQEVVSGQEAAKAQQTEKLATLERQQALKDKLEERIKTHIQTKTQKEGPAAFADIPGDLMTKYQEEAENAVADGKMTLDQAAMKYGDKALEFAKQRNVFLGQGTNRWQALVGPKAKQKLEVARKIYKENGMLELFKDDLISNKKLSPPYASKEAYPISNNIRPYLSGKNINEIASKVLENIKPEDSVLSIALDLKNKGIAPEKFIETLLKKDPNGEKMTSRQFRELQNPGSFEPTLSDIFYFTLKGG